MYLVQFEEKKKKNQKLIKKAEPDIFGDSFIWHVIFLQNWCELCPTSPEEMNMAWGPYARPDASICF